MMIVLQSLVKTSERGRGNESSSTLPNRIRFPYSRHSSYRELCHLLSVLKPRDIWPCTVDPFRWVRQGEFFPSSIYSRLPSASRLIPATGITIDRLFGEYCSGNTFDHDKHMAEVTAVLGLEEQHESQANTESLRQSSPVPSNTDEVTPLSHCKGTRHATASIHYQASSQEVDTTGQQQEVLDLTLEGSDSSQDTMLRAMTTNKRHFEDFNNEGDIIRPGIPEKVAPEAEVTDEDNWHLFDSQESSISDRALETRRMAFEAMLQSSNPALRDGLLSTTNNHSHLEPELGED